MLPEPTPLFSGSAPPADLVHEVERLFAVRVLTTAGIAAALGVSEADVWNARARGDATRRKP